MHTCKVKNIYTLTFTITKGLGMVGKVKGGKGKLWELLTQNVEICFGNQKGMKRSQFVCFVQLSVTSVLD